MMRTILFFLLIIVFELVIVGILSANIISKRNRILGASQIKHVIREARLILPVSSELSYYYEPIPNTIEEVKVDWLDYISLYHYNSEGLHENRDYVINKPNNTFRIITLGDSFTFGQYLENTADNWTEQLENRLNESLCAEDSKFEVLNLGVFGYDIEYTVERFRKNGIKYDPDLVIWFLKDDDFKIINELFMSLERRITKEMGIERDSSEYYFSDNTAYPSWQKAVSEFSNLYGDKEIFKYQKRIIRKFLNTYDTSYQSLLFVTFPKTQESYRKFMHSLSTNKNIHLNENMPDIYEEPGAILPDFHPSKKGHQMISENLFDYLINNKLIPCQ